MCSQTDEQLIESYVRLQSELSQKIITSDTEDWAQDIDSLLSLIGGMDISYDKSDPSIGCVTCVVLNPRNQFQIVYQNNTNIEIVNQYIAGFLAFREIDFLVKEYETLRERAPDLIPQVWIIDGNGLLHPRKFGLASHFGLLTDSPTIGVAKNPYYLTFVDQTVKDEHKMKIKTLKEVGHHFDIRNSSEEVIGVALKTSIEAKNPVYVSIGHKISLETAIKVVLKCCKYRIPEPTRIADIISRQQIRR